MTSKVSVTHPPPPPTEVPPLASSTGLDDRTLHRWMCMARAMEKRTVELYRQGVITGGCYTGIGNEGTSVAAALALESGDVLVPTHRDLGAHLVRGHGPLEIARQYLKRDSAQTRGRDSGLHLGREGSNVVGMISHLGHMMPVACGIALAEKQQGRDRVVLTTIGDGASSLGDVHESMNFAAIQRLAVIFLIENNQYAYSTPTTLQYACESLSDRASGYGMPGRWVDGTDPYAVHHAVREALERGREGAGPSLIESRTMRMRGHSEHDDFAYVPPPLVEAWSRWDPLERLKAHLAARFEADELAATEAEVKAEVDAAFEAAQAEPEAQASAAQEGVFRRWDPAWTVPEGDWELP